MPHNPPLVGIDLGTTYSCMAYVNDAGLPTVIRNADGALTTPSVVAFDGRQALVGAKAIQRKQVDPNTIFEFVKRDMGKPIELPPGIADQPVAPYEVGGFKYGAAGIQAIILRKLKKEAVLHFKKLGVLPNDVREPDARIAAVITVPAYFGDRERQETKLAGYAAGLDTVGIINEPTAAALAYGLVAPKDQTIMVFDLGGGTFDVTILRMRAERAEVLSSSGDNALGGKDWDALVESYIYEAYRRQHGRDIPDDPRSAFTVQELALQAKLELSQRDEVVVSHYIDDALLEATLHRSVPMATPDDEFAMGTAEANTFSFEDRSADLLQRCKVLCESALEHTRLPTRTGTTRSATWADLDEILLAGGACRMPMIHTFLERISGRHVRRHVDGFDYDTAIAFGAALYGYHRGRVRDVASHSIGVKLQLDNKRLVVDHLIRKDSPLPAEAARRYAAYANAALELYEGESDDPDECVLRGRLELANPAGDVGIVLRADAGGVLHVHADYQQSGQGDEIRIRDHFLRDERAKPLRDRVQAVQINL